MPRIRSAALLSLLLAVGLASPAAAAAPGVLAARPATIDFHTQAVGSENYRRTKIVNTSDAPVLLLVTGGLPDDFGFGLMPGSTCPVFVPGGVLAPHESCYAVVRYSPTEFFAGREQNGSLIATATDPTTGAFLAELVIPIIGTGSL